MRIEFMRVVHSGNGNVTRIDAIHRMGELCEKCLANSGDIITGSYPKIHTANMQ